MKDAARRTLRKWRSLSFLLLLVSAVTPLVFSEAHTFVRRAANWLHEGFLAVYVDAGSLISGCF